MWTKEISQWRVKVYRVLKVFKLSSLIWLIFGCNVVLAGSWEMLSKNLTGEEAQMCNKLLTHLKKNSDDNCWMDAMETYPEFSEPPWQSLDPKERFDLIVKLQRYAQEGATAYFNPKGFTFLQPESAYRNRAQLFIDEGGELQVWRTRLMSFYDSNLMHPVPKDEEQTVIRMTTKIPLEGTPTQCRGKSSQGWIRWTFVVLPDLSGPDPQVETSVIRTRWPVLYRGQIRLISHDDVWKDSVGGLESICHYRFTERKVRPVRATKTSKEK